MKLLALTVTAYLLLFLAPLSAGETALVALDVSTALRDVRATRGVVFVDLYADW